MRYLLALCLMLSGCHSAPAPEPVASLVSSAPTPGAGLVWTGPIEVRLVSYAASPVVEATVDGHAMPATLAGVGSYPVVVRLANGSVYGGVVGCWAPSVMIALIP